MSAAVVLPQRAGPLLPLAAQLAPDPRLHQLRLLVVGLPSPAPAAAEDGVVEGCQRVVVVTSSKIILAGLRFDLLPSLGLQEREGLGFNLLLLLGADTGGCACGLKPV